MTSIALPPRSIVVPRFEFPRFLRHLKDERVAHMFSNAVRRPFQNAFASPDTVAIDPILPNTPTGLQIWLKADAITGLNDADPVGSWVDSSANVWSPTATLTTRPLYKTNIINSLPAVLFDGSNDSMGFPAGALGVFNNVASATVLIAQLCNLNSTQQFYFGASTVTAGATTSRLSIGRNNSASPKLILGNRRLDANGNVLLTGTGIMDLNVFQILAGQWTWSASALKGYASGGAASPSSIAWQTAGNTDTTNSNAIRVGSAANATNPFSGYLAELIVYVPALSLATLNGVAAHLRDKYALTWALAT